MKTCNFVNKCELCGYEASSATVLKNRITQKHKQ